MKTKLIAALSTLAFVCSAAVMSGTEAAKASASTASNESAPAMYTAKCPSPCDFSVKSRDKKEVAAILQEHAKTHHDGMVVSDADADAMIKVVTPKK